MNIKYKIIKVVLALMTVVCVCSSCGESSNNFETTENSSLSSRIDSSRIEISSSNEELSAIEENNELEKKIKDYFAYHFSNDGNYTCKEASLSGFSSEGASIEGYYYDDVLEIMNISVYGELGSYTSSYHFIDSETVFCIEKTREYTTHIMEDDWSVEREYDRVYIVLNGESYKFDILKMKPAEKDEDFSKELFDAAISVLEE